MNSKELKSNPPPPSSIIPLNEETEKKKEEREEKVEKERKESFLSFSTNSTFSTQLSVSKQVSIKGIKTEVWGQFKYLANILDLTYSEFIEFLLADFAEHNPHVLDKLSNVVIDLKVKVETPKNFEVPNPKASRYLKETKELLSKKVTRKRTVKGLRAHGLSFRIDILRGFLKDKSVSEDQKQEIVEFIKEVTW